MTHASIAALRRGGRSWLGRRAEEALILAAGLALALPLILSFG